MGTHITAAQPIRPYQGPQWLIQPVSHRLDRHDVAALSKSAYDVLQDHLVGWGPYNVVIRVDGPDERAVDDYYLARLAK